MILSWVNSLIKIKCHIFVSLKNHKISTFQEHKLYKDFNTHNSLMNKKKNTVFLGEKQDYVF
jgi:hypothetical protein